MSTDTIEISGLHKSFGKSPIIRDIALTVRKGERHAIIGPNGAGKSTLFHLISGLISPTSGTIRLNGEVISGLPPHIIARKGLSRSFQITTILPRMTVFENLRIAAMAGEGRRFPLLSPAWRATRLNIATDELMERVRLTASRDKMAGDLSYSEQRSLEIGMALGPDPSVILLDEPMAGMSIEEAAYMKDLILSATGDKTLLVVEHDMQVVFSLADRISVLVYGEVIASGPPDAIRNDRKVQEAYLGEEAA